MSPSRIAGRYELQEQLGEGGMGVVWRALDTKTGSHVAIKLMKDISDPVAVELFTKEWKALAEMSHPNIVEVRDVDVIEENGQKKPLFVMPLLRGATLTDLITNASARLTPERIVEITTQVCRGLQAAHQRGLVHRDLKPSNIFVMDDDTAKIIDFGVVHLAGSKSATGQKGTFQYMSPEQAQLREITPSSDLFSMGVILYEALTRRKPFARATAEETMDAVIKFIPPPVSEINPSINQSVSKVVHKCLAKQPIYRFASARELAETLQRAFRNEPVFDSAKIEPRIERAKNAFKSGDDAFASEILSELEAEGNLDARITVLRMQIDLAVKQKKIRQLLESARARMEQDEIPLALDKLREVLDLDPQNPEALAMRQAMEKQRSESLIAKWIDLAQTHLSNRDFVAARHAAQEVLAIRRADTRALDLIEKIESTEAEAKRIRDQKEQLYGSAMKAYQNGEIETALSKLERLFSVARANPNAAIPERDAVYQSFYNEVRSERDAIHSALEEAQRQFSEKNFAGAMAVCRELVERYPNDGTFQALKIRIEDAERQELSSYIAEVSKRLEAEPDLDRRANVLREACERYPNETQFAQQLKLIRERRDLVNSIVVKAQQFEERKQYAEAINQWDILRNIHPQYPGIAFELEQCKKKRHRQAREEEHSRLVEEIENLVEGRAFAKAIECADHALQDFPGDAELSGLRTLAEQGLERTKESRRLFEEGQRSLVDKDLARATELLRSSLSLDPRGPGLRDAVVNVLTERARTLVDDNWRDAEPLYQEASELDGSHPAVRALRLSITEAKRQTLVGQCLTECRALVAAGNVETAADRVRAARSEYPNDARLEQYEASLQKELNDARRKEERAKDRAVLDDDRRALEQNPDRLRMQMVLERSYAIRAKHVDDPEIGQAVSEIELTVRRVANIDDLSELLNMEPMRTGTDGRVGVVSSGGPASLRPELKRGPQLIEKKEKKDRSAERADLSEPQGAEDQRKESALSVLLVEFGTVARAAQVWATSVVHEAQQRALSFACPAGKWSQARLGAVGGIIVLIVGFGYFIVRTPHTPPPPTPNPTAYEMPIIVDPPDSVVMSESKPVTNGSAAVGAMLEVTHVGYKTKHIQLQQESDGKIALDPEPLRLSIHTSAKSGTVELDGQKIDDFSDGSMPEHELVSDGKAHKLSVTAQGKPLFTLELQSAVGSVPQVTSLDANDVFVIASLGNRAKLYGGTQLKNVHMGDRSIAVSALGSELALTEQSHEIVFGKGSDQGSVAIEISNAPVLAVRSLNASGQISITTNIDNATLTVDGTPVPRQKSGGWTVSRAPGRHKFSLAAENYEPQTWQVTMRRGQELADNRELKPKVSEPVTATLVITGGTPGAIVEIEGKKGVLDSNGNMHLAGIPEGKRTVTISKPDYETETRDIEVHPPNDAVLSNVNLQSAMATLSFQVAAKNVTVRYRRAGDTQFQEADPFAKISLPPGEYAIEAEATGYQKFYTSVNLPKGDTTVQINLAAISHFMFEDATQVVDDGAWIKAKTPGKFINLKAGFLHENLVFAPPGKSWLRDKKVEWQIENPNDHSQVRYALEGQKLTRKLVVGTTTSDAIEKQAAAKSKGEGTSLSVHVSVDGAHILITSDDGAALDDFTAAGHDFSKGRIGIRTDSHFIVRSENQ
jgi:serine/threonine protein kinase